MFFCDSKFFVFFYKGEGLKLRGRSLPLIEPPPLQRFKRRHFVRFNFMVAKSCFATLAVVESALDSALAE